MTASRCAYDRIRNDMRERIRGGDCFENGKLPGERVLAQHYGVSHLTINKALSMLVQEGVLDRRARSGTFVSTGVATGECLLHIPAGGHIFQELALTLIRSLQKEGYATTLTDIGDPLARKSPSKKHDLAILDVMDHGPLELVEAFPARHYVFFPRYCSPVALPGLSVTTDYRAGGYEAAVQFEAWGCRHVAMITHSAAPHSPAWLLLQGLEQRARETGALSVTVSLALHEGCAPELRDLLARGAVDGLFGNADFLLVPVLKAMDELGIPRESVRPIGYYNTPWSESHRFSSFDLGCDELVSMLMEHIRARRFEGKFMIKPRWVPRTDGDS